MLRIFFLLSLLIPTHSYATTKMPTGTEGGTYHSIGRDIAHIAKIYGVDVNVESSVGSIDNIRQLLKDPTVDLSLIQSDVIAALSSSSKTTTQAAYNNLRLVHPLYQEEVHLLANKSILNISNLEGKRVAVGQIGSGTHVTASRILNLLNIKVIPENKLAPLDAYKALLFGKLDAVFFVSGKPISHLQGILEMNNREDLKSFAENIHLLAIEDTRLTELYPKAMIKPSDYVSKNGQHKLTKTPIPTIAVTAALVTKAFPIPNKRTWEEGKRCRQIDRVHRGIRKKLASLASGGKNKKQFHSKWATVDLEFPIKLEKSECITWSKPKTTVTTTAVTSEIVAPLPSKVAVPLSDAELAEANCLLLTGKTCTKTAPEVEVTAAPEQEVTPTTLTETIELNDAINELVQDPSL